MDLARGLTFGQRVQRRLSLWAGRPYTHPDGHIEQEFEEAAGINSRADPTDVQREKLFAYQRSKHQREIANARVGGAFALGFVAYLFAGRIGIDGGEQIVLAVLTTGGLWLLTRD
jgi:hypothetical protein